MSAKEFYKSILSKIFPLVLSMAFFLKILYSALIEKIFSFKQIVASVAIIFIAEITVSFFRAVWIIFRKKIKKNKNGVILYLLIIPYVPAIIGSLMCFSPDDFMNNWLLDIGILSINMTGVFLCSIYINCKINIFKFLDRDE